MESKKVDLKSIELPSNEPKYYAEYEIYADILNKKIEDKNITNIGIVAPYGAGKSSLLKTYITIQSKKNTKFNNKIISVSLANYGSIIKSFKKRKNDDAEEGSAETTYNFDDEQNIEKSILQQLFYKNDNEKTPYSRFRVLKDNTKQNITTTILVIIEIFTVFFLSCQFFDNIFKINFENCWKWIILISVILLMLVCLGFLLFNIFKNKHLKSIQIGNFNFEKNENESISVFNQYLDEIIYFFQKNEFNILIIEDLDRFNNLEIFSKLKELNTLLNKNDKIVSKHGKITFIYAVKDSMFKSEEERSKFFEFILPVIPSLTSENVKDELEFTLREKLGTMPLSSQFVIDVSDYITSRRILNNVINDFIIHSSILNLNINDEEKMDKLFSLMVLKNILPSEYELLQKQDKKSEIYKFLNEKKKEIIGELIQQYEKTINEYDTEVEVIDRECLNDLNDLKNIFYGLICKEYSQYSNISYKLDTFIDNKKIMVTFRTTNRYSSYGSYDQNTNVNISDIEEKYYKEKDYFSRREQVIIKKHDGRKNKLQILRNNCQKTIYQLKNMNFVELCNYYLDKINDLKFGDNYIKLVLVNGYIDETHMDYLSEHSNAFISANDRDIIKRINRKDKVDLFDKIDSPNKVILSLDKNKFGFRCIFNYYIINELIANKEIYLDKFDTFINMINSKRYDIKNILEKIVNSEEYYYRIIVSLCEKAPYIWDLIYESETILDDRKETLLFVLINNEKINIKNLHELNSNGNIKNIINSSHDFCQKFTSKNFKIDVLYKEIGFYLNTIGEMSKNENSNFVIENNLYELNLNNIKTILQCYYGENEVDVVSKNYDLICKLSDDDPFKTRIKNELNLYLHIIYDNLTSGCLSSENLIGLLTNDKIDIDLKKLIAIKEGNTISYNPKLDMQIVELMLKGNKIILSLDDILIVYKNIEKELLATYINNEHENIQITNETLAIDDNFKQFFFNEVDISPFINSIGNGYIGISTFTNLKNILLLLDNGLVSYDVNDFKGFLDNEICLKKYCNIFEKSICNDIFAGIIQLKNNDIKKIYFISKANNIQLFDVILKLITNVELEEILKEENVNSFIESIGTFDILTISCKKMLINEIDNKEVIEELLISLAGIDSNEWINIFKEKNKFTAGDVKYQYVKNEFYLLLNEKTNCTRRNGIARINFE